MKQLVGIALIITVIPLGALAQHDHGGGGMSMPMPSAPASRSGKLTGTLVSRDDTSITIESKQKSSPATFMIDQQTKFKGNLENGAEVVLKYQEQAGGMHKATSVEAKKTKAKRRE